MIILWSTTKALFLYRLVIVMAMVVDGNPEDTWTVRVVDPIETRMMVTVRPDHIVECQRKAVKKKTWRSKNGVLQSPVTRCCSSLANREEMRQTAQLVCLTRKGLIVFRIHSELASPLGKKILSKLICSFLKTKICAGNAEVVFNSLTTNSCKRKEPPKILGSTC